MEDFEGLPSKQNSSSEEAEFQTPRCSHFHRRKKGTFPHTLSFLVSLQIGRKTEAGLLQGVPGSAQSIPELAFCFQVNRSMNSCIPDLLRISLALYILPQTRISAQQSYPRIGFNSSKN